MHFQKFCVSKGCPKQTDLSVLINVASKEFSQVTHLEDFKKNNVENTEIFGR